MKKFLPLFLFLTVVSCGGGGNGSLTIDHIEPSKAGAGQSVLVFGNELEEGDTACFIPQTAAGDPHACPFPAALETSEDQDGALSLTVPSKLPSGDYLIRIARVDHFGGAKNFSVLPRTGDPDPSTFGTPPDSSHPSGSPVSGDVIIPTGGAGSGGTDTTGPTPPPATPQNPDVSLEGTQAKHDQRLGLIQIQYAIQGTFKEVYLYGPLTGGADCSANLVVNPNGSDLIPGSPNYDLYKDQFSGDVCDATGNCHGYTPPSPPGPVNCRIKIEGASGTLYTRMYQKDVTYTLVGVLADDSVKVATKSFTAPEPTLSPRVQILPSAPYIAVGFDFANAASDPTFTLSTLGGCTEDPANPKRIHRGSNGAGTFDDRCLIHSLEETITLTVPGLGSTKTQVLKVTLGAPSVSLQKGDVTCDTQHASIPQADCPGTLTLRGKVERTYQVTDTATSNVLVSGNAPWVKLMKLSVKTKNNLMHDPSYALLQTVDASSLNGGEKIFQNTLRDHLHNAWKLSLVDYDDQEKGEATVAGEPFKPVLTITKDRNDWAYEYDVATQSRYNDGSARYDSGAIVRDHTNGANPYDRCDPQDATTWCYGIPLNQLHSSTYVDGGGYGGKHNGIYNCRNYTVRSKRVIEAKNVKSLEVRCNGFGEGAGYKDSSITFNSNEYGLSSPETHEFTVPGERAECMYIVITYDDQWLLWDISTNKAAVTDAHSPLPSGVQDVNERPFTGFCDTNDIGRFGSDHNDKGFND